MNHEFTVTVYGESQSELVKMATAAADKFYGSGNWREDITANVGRSSNQYYATYYFTDVPEIDERTYLDA